MATLTTADAVSMDQTKLGHVEDLFHQQIKDGLHPGAGLAVYRYGNLVLDIHGGIANEDTGTPVSDETMFVLMSSTKPISAACLYILKDRGLLDWEDPVTKYWPEFGAHGKQDVTINHILTHRGGFPETPKTLPWTDWLDWSKVVNAMEQAVPTLAPGEVLAYHPINYGWVIAEIVRRIDGRPFNQFLAEELTGPNGMSNTYVGLPGDMKDRVSKMHLMEDDADASGYVPVFNQPDVHRSIVPGAAGVASAGDLARFYAMMERGGTMDGVQIIGSDTVKDATTMRVEGTDASLGLFAQRSLGMALGDERMGKSKGNPLMTFGHGGAGTSIGWADAESGLAVGFITNGFRAPETNNPRLAAMSQAVRDACR
jgi:CubicO group peptidase (beta-lactamase class C family)